MQSITSTIPFSADVVLLGRIVEPGETVEVSDEQAAALLDQVGNWTTDAAPVPVPDPTPEPAQPEPAQPTEE
jgi:hypothetical protein